MALLRMSVPLPSLAMPLLPPLIAPAKLLVPELSRYSNWLVPRLRLPEVEIVRPPAAALPLLRGPQDDPLLKVWVWTSLFVSPPRPA